MDNNYKNGNYHKKEKKTVEKKVTYDSLMQADIISETKENNDFNNLLIFKCIAVSIVLFAIIIGSLLLFSKM